MSELNEWFQERNAWVRSAVNKVQEKERLKEDDYNELVDLCIKEAKNDLNEDDIEEVEIYSSRISSDKVKLKSLKNIKNINALNPNNPLEFSAKNLSIIYGQNGTGKSGYVRILKHICGARHPGKLLPNVFKDSYDSQKCEVDYQVDGNSKTIIWEKGDGEINELSSIDIYDAGSGKVYVSDENEVTYEPPLLELFSDLVKVSGILSDEIKDLIDKKTSKKPSIPSRFEDTEIGQWYLELNHEVLEETVAELTEWTDESKSRIEELKERLNTETPTKKAEKIAKKKERLENLILSIIIHIRELSDGSCSEIIKLDISAAEKEKVAKTAAQKIFSSAPLKGIGSDTWEKLWEKAREYSEDKAYTKQKFPVTNDGSRCVLCQQELSDDAKDRLQSFEDYVRGELKKEAVKARNKHKKRIDELTPIDELDNILTNLEVIGIDDEGIVDAITKLYSVFNQRFNKITQISEVEELPSIPQSWALLKEVRRLTHIYSKKIKEYHQDAEEDNRAELEKEFNELKAKKWVSNQKEAILKELKRLKKVHILAEAKKLTNPVALSRKKGNLAEELITEAFVERFNNELKKLGANWINIELVKTRVQKGRVLHKLQLENAEQQVPEEVLSEGENRIVSLAAFLADVTGEDIPAPFVFDDPITSLDEDFEQAVVERLVELSQDRQVIVFTHRIALISELKNFAKKLDRKTNLVSIRRIDNTTGNPCNSPIYVRNPKSVLNQLLNERLSYAKKAYKDEVEKDYESEAKAICSDFRILLERMIENVLMADLVQRFRRDLHTKGKIHELSKINESDCQYLDDMMSKYSKYEHSQPSRSPVPMPPPDELEIDLNKLKEWYDKFTNR